MSETQNKILEQMNKALREINPEMHLEEIDNGKYKLSTVKNTSWWVGYEMEAKEIAKQLNEIADRVLSDDLRPLFIAKTEFAPSSDLWFLIIHIT